MRDGYNYKFWVYILSSQSGTLYVGVTGFFNRRIHQHKYDTIESFTQKYQCHRLVYYESYQDVQVAIAREKQMKRWRREKKINLIEKLNPRWQDLAENWGRKCGFGGRVWKEVSESVLVLPSSSGSLHSSSVAFAPLVIGRDDNLVTASLHPVNHPSKELPHQTNYPIAQTSPSNENLGPPCHLD